MVSFSPISHRILLGSMVSLISLTAQAGSLNVPAKIQEIDKIFAEWNPNIKGQENTPGCMAFAFQDDKIILKKGYGMADMAWSQPIDQDTVFYLASTSKQFMAAAVALLVLDGKVKFDDDIRKYIPELPNFGPKITVHNLMHHTSGLRDYFTLAEMAGNDLSNATNQDVLDLIVKQKDLNFKPGTDYSYSNSGYVMLSILIERVTGETAGKFAKRRMFDPLGMHHTHWDEDHQKVVIKRARSYNKDRQGTWKRYPKTIDSTGGGNLLSTVNDLIKWDRNFYNPNPKVGGEALIKLLQTPGYTRPDGSSYALGLSVGGQYRGLSTVSHGGSMYGFRIQLMRFPAQHFSSGVLCNTGTANATSLSYKIADVYLKDQLGGKKKKPVKKEKTKEVNTADYKISSSEMNEYIGRYYNSELDITATVTLEEGKLYYSQPRRSKMQITARSKDEFLIIPKEEWQNKIKGKIVKGKNNKITRLILDLGRVSNFRLEKIK